MQDGVSRLMEWVSNVRLGAKHGGQELCSQRLNWQDQVLEVLPWRFRSEQLTFPFIHSWQFVLGRCVSLARILATLSDFQSSFGSCRPWFVSGAGDPVAMWEQTIRGASRKFLRLGIHFVNANLFHWKGVLRFLYALIGRGERNHLETSQGARHCSSTFPSNKNYRSACPRSQQPLLSCIHHPTPVQYACSASLNHGHFATAKAPKSRITVLSHWIDMGSTP